MTEHRTLVIRITPKLKAQLICIALALLLLVGLSFYGGMLRGLGQAVNLREKARDLSIQVKQQALELEASQAEIFRANKAAEIDRLAAESVRKDLLAHRQEKAELQRDVEFYRGLLAPDEVQRGLKLHALDVTFDELTELYTFKAVITNVGGRGNVVKGNLNMAMLAYEEGKSHEVNLSELPDYSGKMPIKLRFRFFQNIEGSFRLPNGLQPVSLVASADVKDVTGDLFSASYDWATLIQNTKTGEL